MPFTIPEALSDFPEAMSLINEVATAVQGWPNGKPPNAKAVGDLLAEIGPALGAMIDKIAKQASD